MPEPLSSMPLACPACKHVIGWVHITDGIHRLHLPGGGKTPSMSFECDCGAITVWSSSDHRLERLLKKMERGEA